MTKNLLDELLELGDVQQDPLGALAVQEKPEGDNPVPVVIKRDTTTKEPVIVEDAHPLSPQDDDLAFARKKMRSIIHAAEKAFGELAQVAEETQQPRAYEVLANLLKTASEATKDLISTHKTKAEIKRLEQGGNLGRNWENENAANITRNNSNNVVTQVTVEKAVFVGTATDLLDQINEQKVISNDIQ